MRALVERVLRDRPGLSPAELLASADSAAERMVKPGSVRVELHMGQRQGRYESKEGRWSLARSPADGGDAPDTAASPEPDSAAGASAGAPLSEAGQSPESEEAAGSQVGDGGSDENAASRDPETGGDQRKLGMNW